jgi:hypothetical protein
MREQILKTNVLVQVTYKDITEEYGTILPENILMGATASIDSDLPKFVNNFTTVLNSIEQEERYLENNTIDEAIELFNNNPDLDASIQKAINNTTYVAVSDKGNLSAKEVLEACVFGIASGT